MYDKLSENAQKLYDLLFTTDFDAEMLRLQLKTGEFSAEDVNRAAIGYVEDCVHPDETHSDWDHDAIDEKYSFGEDIPGLESSHLLEAMRILLDFGLDPNFSTDGDITGNIMWAMHFVFNGYQAADAVALIDLIAKKCWHSGDIVANGKLAAFLEKVKSKGGFCLTSRSRTSPDERSQSRELFGRIVRSRGSASPECVDAAHV